ncbi:MAG: hypothetical protein V1697_00105 [Candidatus Levyibacteriota bacterium]
MERPIFDFPKKYFSKVLTLPDEKLVMSRRKHVYVLFVPLIFTVFFALVFLFASYYVFIFLIPSFSLITASMMVVLMALFSFSAKIITDWYFHFYVVTNKRIIEISHVPLFSHTMYDVLLSQVRCTEIDVKINGIIHQLLDIGDITVAFDRPTHQEEFVFYDIKDPRAIGAMLGDEFTAGKNEALLAPIWNQVKKDVGINRNGKTSKFKFIEEIFPGEGSIGLAN